MVSISKPEILGNEVVYSLEMANQRVAGEQDSVTLYSSILGSIVTVDVPIWFRDTTLAEPSEDFIALGRIPLAKTQTRRLDFYLQPGVELQMPTSPVADIVQESLSNNVATFIITVTPTEQNAFPAALEFLAKHPALAIEETITIPISATVF
jgi:hypothetical protein